ncbi:MAG: DMT family transporter, partial [candidate division Zixibacteria bacterium]|nr:DMT family transporter [candidate division Zixibacteria bacterium]
EISALAAAFFWSFTAIFFSEAGRIIGSYRVNKIRLIFAVVIYMIILTITTGRPIPTDLNLSQIGWLSVSGLIGLVIGDAAGFKALVMIGPRLTTLLFCTVPIITTLVAWVFLGEKLHIVDLLGVAITIGGVSWVVMERRYQQHNHFGLHEDHPDRGTLARGVFLATIASICQAVGLVLSKQGMMFAGSIVDPMQASLVRMIAAVVAIWGWALFRGEIRGAIEAATNGRAMLFTLGGALFGPFLGVWSALVALAHTSAGIAATLNSTSPILILPTIVMYYKERVSLRAILGAIIAVVGVTILFLGDEIFGLR